ncbi:MAG: hypothetical protein H6765_10875 [Candidatus Peribacteria bacterium]|nr:MAG: hypothetical protein H6765_10875 [Candidatus Peribacteria bacterium]
MEKVTSAEQEWKDGLQRIREYILSLLRKKATNERDRQLERVADDITKTLARDTAELEQEVDKISIEERETGGAKTK